MKKKWLILTPLLLIILLLISLPILAVSKPYSFEERKSTDLMTKFIKSEKLGTITATEDDINGFINTYLERHKNLSKISIEKANIKIGNADIELIAQILYQKYRAQVSLKGSFEIDNEYIYLNPSSFKVGRLNVPKSLVFNFLKDKQTDFIQDEKIKFPKEKFPVNITEIYLEPKQITVNFTKRENLIFSKQEENNQKSPQNTTQSQTKTQKQTNTTTQNSNKKIVLINKLNSQLDKTLSNLKLKEQKQIIYQIQNTLNSMTKTSKYDYTKDIPKVKALYNKLTPQQKEEFKQVLFNNVSIDLLFELKSVYGM
ncbi:DUF2140 family protein [Caloramator sp. ALD01]|uniref:DUF2140 family protein n=1 Tax=Caloramator sp. ALD01 TaxID=1031288 RepID=UPI000400B6CF|nr:DUF2140 family protein [Caloramator sp. ALD01]